MIRGVAALLERQTRRSVQALATARVGKVVDTTETGYTVEFPGGGQVEIGSATSTAWEEGTWVTVERTGPAGTWVITGVGLEQGG